MGKTGENAKIGVGLKPPGSETARRPKGSAKVAPPWPLDYTTWSDEYRQSETYHSPS